MIYITGDTHGNFERLEKFCKEKRTTKEDLLIILGDFGANYYGGYRDYQKKNMLRKLPITIFAIHGNHEQRPYNIQSYTKMVVNGGIVYYEEEYPNLLFAKDGEIFEFDGLKTMVIGGAYSIDKNYRLRHRQKWWKDEQPSEDIKAYVEKQLDIIGWDVDIVLSHTAPIKYEPVEAFMPGIDQRRVDKSTEMWLDSIEDILLYKKWYCGHYHIEKKVDNLEFMFKNFGIFGIQ